jgi:signal transduction histidine kinase
MGFATDQEHALASLLVSAMNAREQEGARVSRILHDDIGQVLSAIGLQLDLLRMDLGDKPEESARRIAEIQKVIELAVAQVRDLSYELNPAIVERTGLQFALDRLVGRYRKHFGGTIRLFYDPAVRLPMEAAIAFFRVAEQALENAVQHSHGRKIEVFVRLKRQGTVLEMRDDGVGFSSEVGRESRGLGLHIMQHYAEQAKLQFSVASAPEKGTIVKAVFPAARPQNDAKAR